MANYLTIEQASNATGKSTRTIRRLCYNEISKDFITHDEKNRLLVDANYLAQHYPLTVAPKPVKPAQNDNRKSFDKSNDKAIDSKLQDNQALLHKIELLEQELKLKSELFHTVTREKDNQIEVLKQSVLLLGEGLKKDSSTIQNQHEQVIQEQEPTKKKRWWSW